MEPGRLSFFGLVTTGQAIIVLLVSIFFLLNSYCIIDYFGHSTLGIILKITYLHDPGLCGTRINIGRFIEGMANQAFVRMEHAPFTYYRTLYFSWLNFAIAILWLIANELLFRNYAVIPWIMITLSACVVDFSALIIYLNEYNTMKTLPDLLSYIGLESFGTGKVLVETSIVAPFMGLCISKCGVFLLINSLLIIWLSVMREPRYNNNVDVEAEPPIPMFPVPFARDNAARTARRLPRPNLHRTNRNGAALRIREMMTALSQERASPPVPGHATRELATILPYSEPTPSPDLPQRAFSADDVRIRVPDTILSLPQRLEKLIAQEARKYELGLATTENRPGHSKKKEGGKAMYFPELSMTLPPELEQTMACQKRCLDVFTYNVHPKHNKPLSISLPNLTDGILYPETNELYMEYRAWRMADEIADGMEAWRKEEGYNSRLRKQLRPRVDPHYFNITGRTESMYREGSVEHLAWTGSGKLRRLVFFSSKREQPDVLY